MTRVSALFASFCLLSVPAWTAKWADTSLKNVQKVFIEKMQNDFDQDLRTQITRQFRGRVNVVLDREIADAILVAVSKEDKASTGKSMVRYLGMDNVSEGTLTLLDKSGKVILWSDEAGDRAPWISSSPIVPNVRKTIAERLVKKLKKAIDTATR